MMHSLSMLGVLVAGVGGFILVASWDSGRTRKTHVLAYMLIGAGIALFAAGVIIQ